MKFKSRTTALMMASISLLSVVTSAYGNGYGNIPPGSIHLFANPVNITPPTQGSGAQGQIEYIDDTKGSTLIDANIRFPVNGLPLKDSNAAMASRLTLQLPNANVSCNLAVVSIYPTFVDGTLNNFTVNVGYALSVLSAPPPASALIGSGTGQTLAGITSPNALAVVSSLPPVSILPSASLGSPAALVSTKLSVSDNNVNVCYTTGTNITAMPVIKAGDPVNVLLNDQSFLTGTFK